jgi:uncharacterized protein (TIGR03067 family)
MKPQRWSLLALTLLSIPGCARTSDGGATANTAPGAAAIPVVPRDLAADDLNMLRGKWEIERLVWNGVRDPDAGNGVAYIFEGDKFIMVDDKGNRQVETIKLLPGQYPKAIDCWGEAGQAVPGIYSLENDTLTWCAAGGGNKNRPTAFSSEPGSKQSLMVFRRK